MINEITFEKTNNFWIDNGIVSLYRTLDDVQNFYDDENNSIEFEYTLNTEKLLISVKNTDAAEEHLITILNKAKEVQEQKYLTNTQNVGWFYKDEQFELYQKKDFKMHLKSFFTGKTPRTEGALCTPDAKDSDVGSGGRRMNESEYHNFQLFKEKHGQDVVQGKKVSISGKGFLNSPPKYDLGTLYNIDFEKEGKNKCTFSGNNFKEADTVNGMVYPFFTGKSGEMNFASNLSGKPKLSSKYAFVSFFSFDLVYYLINNGLFNYFVIYEPNLKELNYFHDKIQVNVEQLKSASYCNFTTEIIGCQYEYETLLAFIISVYNQVKNNLNHDERKNIFRKSVYTFTNDGNIFRDVKEYSSLEQMFRLLDEFQKNGEFETFANLIRFFHKHIKKTEYDTTWRNRLASDILMFRSVNKTMEAFLSEVKMKEEKNIYKLDKLLEIYNLLIDNGMNKEMVETCKRIGNSIGRYCRDKEDKGILFSIRNSRNRIDFLKVLSESQFRTEVLLGEDFFINLPDTHEWEEYKCLVSIFAMNSYLSKFKNANETVSTNN